MRLVRILTVGGAVCVVAGGILTVLARAKGRYASQLEGITEIESIKELKHLLKTVPLLVAVTGRVWAPFPVGCELSDAQGAIVTMKEEQLVQPNRRSGGARSWHQYGKETPWALTEGRGPFAVHVPVQVKDDVVDHLLGHRLVDTRRTELYLPQGAEVTVVGELDLAETAADIKSLFFLRSFRGSMLRPLVLKEPAAGGPFVISEHRLPQLLADAQRFQVVAGCVGSYLLLSGAVMLSLALHLRLRRALE